MTPLDESYEQRQTQTVDIALPSGSLELSVANPAQLFELFDFGVRANPKRGFLFISKVLGKHLAAKPSVMQQTHQQLAHKLAGLELPMPLQCIGMAETATCLGQGVFEEYLTLNPDADAAYIQSTRIDLDQAVALKFQEPHSHATGHQLYTPIDDKAKHIFQQAKTLVLIDDELTTGHTLCNLAKAYQRLNSGLERIVFVSLASWMDRAPVLTDLACPVDFVNLLAGQYRFTPNPDYQAPDLSQAAGMQRPLASIRQNTGRFGTTSAFDLSDAFDHSPIVAKLDKQEPLLVLGHGEFMFVPYQVALRLEQLGFDVTFKATTRSPIVAWGCVASRTSFPDPIDAQTENYLYNVSSHNNHVLVFETQPTVASQSLVEQLKALALYPKDLRF